MENYLEVKVSKFEAVRSLSSKGKFCVRGDVVEWMDDELVQPSEAAIQTEMERLQVEYDLKKYQRQREVEYPSTADQLDKIYHEGIDAWKTDMIKPVKDKYPKE